jgi:hypothetical protein
VYRLRYGSKSELQGQREEQLDRTRRGISAATTLRKSYGKVINRTLTQKNMGGHEQAIYYLSRVLQGFEKRYSPIEKMCLCLY